MSTPYQIQTTVQNISDDKMTAIAVATNWLKDVIDEVDIASADASSGRGETTVDFILRLSDADVEALEQSEVFLVLRQVE